MDALIPLLLMLALYLVPELLKKRKNPKEYQYPDVPDREPQPIEIKPAKSTVKHIPQLIIEPAVTAFKKTAGSPQTAVSMPAAVDIPHTVVPVSPWQGKLSQETVKNGLIFSEILQPPRAYRPIWRTRK